MKNRIVVSPSNKVAIKFLQSIKDKKAKMQKHFSQPGNLTTLIVDFDSIMVEMRRDYRKKSQESEILAGETHMG